MLFAARNGRLKYLKEAGTNLQVKDNEGAVILHSAAASNDVMLFDYCMKALGPDSTSMLQANGKNDGVTPLHCATEAGNVAIHQEDSSS